MAVEKRWPLYRGVKQDSMYGLFVRWGKKSGRCREAAASGRSIVQGVSKVRSDCKSRKAFNASLGKCKLIQVQNLFK